MVLIASALFALLEASRFQEMKRLAYLQTQVALESVFAEYNTYLWEEYHLLACEQSQLLQGIEDNGNSRLLDNGMGSNFYQFQVEDVELEGYTRLTDGDGKAFVQAVSGYMEENLLYESAKNIYGQYEVIKQMMENSDFSLSQIEKVWKALKERENSEGTAGRLIETVEIEEESISRERTVLAEENPLEVILKLQKMGILSLVLEDTSNLSAKEIDLSSTVSNRTLPEDNYSQWEEIPWYDRVLFQQYILTYLSNYMDEKEHSLSYEVEYLLGGKATEVENLKVVVNQLLALREAANLLYLSSNPTSVEQAGILAVSLAGASLNPISVEAVKAAILVAWAFGESVLDVRTLLAGGRIALLKSESSWTTELEYLSSLGEGYAKAKNCKQGLDYEEYLGVLLLFQQETQLAKRSLDVQEQTLRLRYENLEIYMEDWVIEVRARVRYGYAPVFFSVEQVLPDWSYEISVNAAYEY